MPTTDDALTAPRVSPRAPRVDGRPAPVEVDRRLPAHRGKVGRISEQLAGLSSDVREIVELRIELFKREVMEQVEGRISTVKGHAVVGVLALVTVVFALSSLALGIGMLLGHPFWGFLIVTGIFLLATLIAKRVFAPGAVRVDHDRETGKVRLSVDDTPADAERKRAVEAASSH